MSELDYVDIYFPENGSYYPEKVLEDLADQVENSKVIYRGKEWFGNSRIIGKIYKTRVKNRRVIISIKITNDWFREYFIYEDEIDKSKFEVLRGG